MKTFWQFVDERMKIHERRAAGQPRPWTTDVVLRDNFFTNCFRELDPGTKVAVAIVSRRKKAWERLWNLVLYRRLNNNATWAILSNGRHIKPRDMEESFRNVTRYGAPLFTGAHQVHSLHGIVRGEDFIARQANAMNELADGVTLRWLVRELKRVRTPHEAFNAWQKAIIPGVGTFLSWQLALDCRYGPIPLARFSDDEWAPVQAGALAGLKIVFKQHLAGAKHSKEGLEDLLIPLRNSNDNTHNLTVAAIEHSLCEYSKYVRIANGGHAKGKYHGR